MSEDINKEIREDKTSVLYIPNPKPDLDYETTGHVDNNTDVPIVTPKSPDPIEELHNSGDAIVSAMAYMPKTVSTIIENTIKEVLRIVDTPTYNPDGPSNNTGEVPNTPPTYKYDDDENADVPSAASTPDNNDINVPDFFPPAPNYDLVVTTFKPLYQIASDVYTSDMYDVKQYFVNRLQDSMSKYFSQMVQIKNECGMSDLIKLTNDFDAVAANVTDQNLVHLSDYIVRSQIIRDQKTRLFNKTHNTNETLYHLRHCLAAFTQRARYYKAAYGESSTFLSTKSNTLLLESRQQYDKSYEASVYNLFKYLNSSVLIIDENLKMSLKEAEAKGQLYKKGVNIFLTST